MLNRPGFSQTQIEMVTLDQLVPKDHLLRKIEAAIDFSFIHDRVAGLYCPDNGRPPLDPTLMFKALFIGYLFGVRSERQLVREIEVNVAYRWFLRLGLTDAVFDASTLSQNRRRRFNDTSVAQDIFDAIVQQALDRGFVEGRVLYTDSTHLKANANKNKYDLEVVAKSRSDYWSALDAAIDADRASHGKPPQKPREREPQEKETKVSRTDPESGYMVRDGKPTGFFYLDHRTVDGAFGIITDTFATPANVHDSIVYLSRLDRQKEKFDLGVQAVGLDAGYATAGIAKGLEERQITGVVGYRNPTPPKPGMMRKSAFKYDRASDGYRCPQGELLTYATTDRSGYRHYTSDPARCRACPLLGSCTGNAKAERTITRHIWQDARERSDANRLTPWGKLIYKRRKETVERSFADAKQLFGHRYARFRGLVRVSCQCLLAAAAQNIKKIALILAAKASPAAT
jgi:transposase